MYDKNDTIIALATGMGKGSIAVIRISGNRSIPIVSGSFKGKDLLSTAGNTTHLGWIHRDGHEIDQVVAAVYKAPNSYTGEDYIEISCHANALIIDKIIETMIKHGARLAKPGEFTFRAFMNGKMSLSQAEAVADIISTRSRYGVCNSLRQLHGDLNDKIEGLKDEITSIRSLMEIVLDFSADEEVIDPEKGNIDNRIKKVEADIRRLADSYNHAKILSGSITVTIIGQTNVGKSTLMNVLLGEERVITSHTPGTTRDIVHEDLIMDDFHFKLIDTAGLRDSSDHVEIKGMEKTRMQTSVSDIILWVIDASQPWQPLILDQIEKIIGDNRDRLLLVVNKSDIKQNPGLPGALKSTEMKTVKVSALRKTGIKKLKKTIISLVTEKTSKFSEELIITNLRQRKVLENILRSLRKARSAIRLGQGYEFASIDLQTALDSLGEITGETTTEEILNRIFSGFCIGK